MDSKEYLSYPAQILFLSMGIILLGTGSGLAKVCERAGERKAAVVSQTIDPGVFQVLAIRFASTIGEPYTGPVGPKSPSVD